jgi:hypothetical protein
MREKTFFGSSSTLIFQERKTKDSWLYSESEISKQNGKPNRDKIVAPGIKDLLPFPGGDQTVGIWAEFSRATSLEFAQLGLQTNKQTRESNKRRSSAQPSLTFSSLSLTGKRSDQTNFIHYSYL